jgi:hypothetical protein
MDSSNIKSLLYKDSTVAQFFTTDFVTCCLSDCNDCLGSYTNEVLSHRFLCRCKCHNRPEVLPNK